MDMHGSNSRENEHHASPDPGGTGRDERRRERELMYLLAGHLTRIRVFAMGTRKALKELSIQVANAPNKTSGAAAAPPSAADLVWQERCLSIHRNLLGMQSYLTRIDQEIFRGQGCRGRRLYELHGDEVAYIEQYYQGICRLWNQYADCKVHIPSMLSGTCKEDVPNIDGSTRVQCIKHPPRLVGRIKDLDRCLCRIIYTVNKVVMIERINEELDQMHPGTPFRFSEFFTEEACPDDDEAAMLRFVEKYPKKLHGIVDPEQKVIYAVSTDQRRRWLSYGLLAAVATFVVFVLPILLQLLLLGQSQGSLQLTVPTVDIASFSASAAVNGSSIQYPGTESRVGDPLSRLLVLASLAVVAGGIAHVLVGWLKQVRGLTTGSNTRTAPIFENWALRAHVNERPYTVAILTLGIGFLGLVMVFRTVDLVTAFFVGYSIDSLVELFLQRFVEAAGPRTEDLKKAVKETAS
jgi:hypothetical protein